MTLFENLSVQFICLLISSSVLARSCDDLFNGKKSVTTSATESVFSKFKQHEDELKFLKQRAGKDVRVVVFESDATFSETLRELKIDSFRKNSDDVVYFVVSEVINGETVIREVPFARLTVLGEARADKIEFQKIPRSKFDEVLKRRYAETWQDNFSVFYTAFIEKKWILISDLSQKTVLMAQVEAIDVDSMDTIVIRLSNVNGTSVSRTIHLSDFHKVDILGRIKRSKVIYNDISHVFPDRANELNSWEYSQLLEMEFMNPVRVASLSNIKSAIENNLHVEWKENGKMAVGRIHRLFVDDSYMPIVEIKDPNSERSIYRTLKSLDGIKAAVTSSRLKTSHPAFEKAGGIFFNVSEASYRELKLPERQLLQYWKSALVSGLNVRWYQARGSTLLDGRIEQIFSDSSGEILIVVRTQHETYVKTFDGFTLVPSEIQTFGSVAESILQIRHYPTITNDQVGGSTFDSRVRISKKKERDLVNHENTKTTELLKFALFENKMVDLQFQREVPGEYRSELVKNKRRVQILGIDDETIIVKFLGEQKARIVTALSIRSVTVVED